MKQLWLHGLLGLALLAPAAAQSARQEITLRAADGVTVYGDFYPPSADSAAPVLLLFHQGGANARAEYGPLLPRLQERGYAILAIDQRRGGDRLGGTNRTVEALEGDADYSYCDAYPDLEAALSYLRDAGYAGRRILWGSSYSAALAVQLAAKHAGEVHGVLAFSPASGEPMEGCRPDAYLGEVTVPMLLLRPAAEMEIESVQRQLGAFAEAGHRAYVAKDGVHGSSMLNPDRVDGPVEPNWQVVLAFLEEIATRP